MAAVPLAAACRPSPAVDADGHERPTPSPPPPLAGLDEGLAAESEAVAWCLAVTKKGYELPAGLTANLAKITVVHRRHLEALQLDEPLTRPSGTPSAGLDPQASEILLQDVPVAKATQQLRTALEKVSATHRSSAIAANGETALFWASLAASAAQSVEVISRRYELPKLAGESALAPVAIGDEAEALAALVSGTHALVYGCQVALSGVSGGEAEAFAVRLTNARRLRDAAVATMHAQGSSPPAAEAAYQVDIPDDADQAADLVRTMESALLPLLGAVVAATMDEGVRQSMINSLISRSAGVITLGAAPLRWPGYPQ